MKQSLLNPGHCVANNLHKTARAVSRIYAEEMRRTGLARSQFAILATLYKAGPLALTELADRLCMERTTLTRNLKPLEKAGLVRSRGLATDRRVKLVSISDDGRERYQEAFRAWRKAQRRLLELLGDAGWSELERRLTNLRHLVTERPRG